jgi:HlyD family secretion protein
MKRVSKKIWIVSALLALIAAGVLVGGVLPAAKERRAARQAPSLLTQTVSVGEVRRSISASGSLKPVSLVDVGTQISGTIRALHVDYNAEVKAGQVLAQLDPSLLDADLAQVQAQQRSAQTQYELAQTRLARSSQLYSQGFIARAEVDEANAAVRSAKASVDQFGAAVSRAAKNRSNAQIVSPVSGTVVAREVQVGQTVAASLQTPVLFRIAKDLRDMQIEMNVSEADVGFMKDGQAVRFTVDAYPERSFTGSVHQVRNNPITQQNVVTYTVIVRTRNEDLALRPGMTAYVSVIVGERQQVVRVPNAALRYEPAVASKASGPAVAPSVTPSVATPSNQRTVWLFDAETQKAQAVAVTLGLADGRYTELVAGSIREGDALVIGERVAPSFSGPKLF